MQESLRECPSCKHEFNQTTHIPLALPDIYGQLSCSQCLQGVLNERNLCPRDSIEPTSSVQVSNLSRAQIVSEALGLSDLCSIHQQPRDFFCFREYEKKCIDCSKECLNNRHKVRFLKEYEIQAEETKEILQNFAHEFDAEKNEIDLLKKKEEGLITAVEETFELFKKAVEGAKNQIKEGIHKILQEPKTISYQSLNNYSKLKDNADSLLQILNNKVLDKKYFDALRTPLDDLKISSEKHRIDAAFNELDGHIQTIIRVELGAPLATISTILRTQGPLGGLQVEQNRIQNHQEVPNNNDHGVIEEKEEEQPQQTIPPRMEMEEEDYLQAVPFFYAEIEEDDRLILSFKNQQIETENILNGDLEKLKTISKVTLNINKSQKWKEAIENLRQIWSKLGKVLDLKIAFFKIQAKEILNALIEQNNIWANADLLEFTIDLKSSPVEDEHLIQLYERAILNMVNVQKLEIVLEKTQITDHSVKVFAERALPNLANLREFRFYVDKTKVSDDAIESLLAAIHNNNINLTGLAFGFDKTTITDKTIENIANTVRPLASELRRFDLSVKNTNVSDDSLKILSNFEFNKLQEFSLDLGYTQVSNKGLELFGTSTLQKMDSLEVFELFLNKRKAIEGREAINEEKAITNRIIYLIAKGFDSSNNLKKICLELGGTGISGKALEPFTSKNYPALETFELYIAETTGIDQGDLRAFLSKIGKDKTFKNLKNLSFCFSQLKLTENNCQVLANSIQQCTNNLQSLKLTLGKNENITDKGFDYLSHGIHQVLQKTKLTEFQLYLDSTKVTDQGLKVFSEQVVKSLIGVKSFELYLIFLPGVTDQGAET